MSWENLADFPQHSHWRGAVFSLSNLSAGCTPPHWSQKHHWATSTWDTHLCYSVHSWSHDATLSIRPLASPVGKPGRSSLSIWWNLTVDIYLWGTDLIVNYPWKFALISIRTEMRIQLKHNIASTRGWCSLFYFQMNLTDCGQRSFRPGHGWPWRHQCQSHGFHTDTHNCTTTEWTHP